MVALESERSDIVTIDPAAAARASALEDARILPVRLALPTNLPTDEVLRPMVTSFPIAVYGSEAKARSAASDWSPESNALLGLAMSFLGSTSSEQPDEAKAVTQAVADLDAARDDDTEALAGKERHWTGILSSTAYRHQKLAADAWFVVQARPGDAFSVDAERLWRAVLRRQSGELAWVSTAPDDPSLN